ncbi:MAG: hypothetical protein ACREHF_06600 [Rhizomicrobium sp.]
MRVRIVVAAASLLLASGPPLFAQEATTPASPNPSTATPAAPAAAPKPTPAKSNSVLCEYIEDQGEVVPLRQCVSRDEATRRRIEQQEAIRQFQMQSLTTQPH